MKGWHQKIVFIHKNCWSSAFQVFMCRKTTWGYAKAKAQGGAGGSNVPHTLKQS